MSIGQPISSPPTLRPARPEDRDPAIALQLAAFEPLTRTAWGTWDAAAFAEGMREEWRLEQTRCLWLDKALIGFVRRQQLPTHDWLDLIVVDPAQQGRGIGGMVMRQLIAEAAARGVPLWLSVYRINPARRLYARLGFSTHPRDDVRVLMGHPGRAAPPPERLAVGPDRS